MMKWIRFSAFFAPCFLLLACIFSTSVQAHSFEHRSVHSCHWTPTNPSDTHHKPGPPRPIGLTGPAGPQGPAGPRGPIGPRGSTGPIGPRGPIGLTGPQGVAGINNGADFTGPVGPRGATGPAGPRGPQGNIGPQGPYGPQGPAGPIGPQGNIGITGNAGPQGPAGPAGAIGPVGPAGATGTAGPVGPQGPAGPASELDQFAYIYNEAAQVVPVEGDVTFNTHGIMSSGISHLPGTSQIQITSSGIYHLTFSVSGVEPNQFTVFLNGAPVIGTTYGSGSGTQQNNGQVIVDLTIGDILTLRNHTSESAVTLQTLAGGTQTNVNASILLEKISPQLT